MRRVAIVRLSSMGDIVHASPAIQMIRQAYPECKVDWFVDARFAEVLENHPGIHTLHALPLKQVAKTWNPVGLYRIVKSLRNSGMYDVVIDMQGLVKSALVTTYLEGRRHGFDKQSVRETWASVFYDTVSRISYDAHILKRNVRVVADALGLDGDTDGFSGDSPSLYFSDNVVDQAGVWHATDRKNVIFILGSSKAAKTYPKERYAELASALDVHVGLVWHGLEQKADAEWIAAHCPNTLLLPEMNLDLLKAVIAHADLVIGGDTGPTHMAWALKRPSVTLFGNTPLERFCLGTDINRCIAAQTVRHSRHFDRNDRLIGQIEPEEIASVAKGLL